MSQEDRNNAASLPSKRSKKHFLQKPLFGVGILALGIFALFYLFKLSSDSNELVVYHGPNPQIENTEMVASVGAALQNTTSNDASQQIVSPSSAKKEYGIAAGGGLIYLGQEDLNHYFESLNTLGVTWVRWDLDWRVIQPDNSTSYKWDGADRVAATAARYGIKSLAIITYTPTWAKDKSCVAKSYCNPANPNDFAHFAGVAAQRYKGSILNWEIWNEPNYALLWGSKPSAEKYSELLKDTYLEIKKANPSAVVLNGGLAASGNESDGSISPITFMSSLYKLGANQYFDAVAIHPYTYPALPEYQADWNTWQELLPLHDLMVKNNEGSKKIWVTEFGAPTNGPGKSYVADQLKGYKYGTDFMDEGGQASIAKQALDLYNQYASWMGPFFWYSLKDDSDDKNSPENFFGLLHTNGSPKKAYDLLRQAIISNGK